MNRVHVPRVVSADRLQPPPDAGRPGTVLFAPPFRDPFNYNFDPLIPLGVDMVGAAMHTRLRRRGEAGRHHALGASYSTWWNGGLRTTAYFHNMIGLLTETIGNPTPMRHPVHPGPAVLPNGDLAYPVAPQPWHFRQSIDYSITVEPGRARLRIARYRETLLFDIYLMGKHAIEHGSHDSWTITPPSRRQAGGPGQRAGGHRRAPPRAGAAGSSGAVPTKLFALLHDPDRRDPRGYILPADQPDFPTATKFVNALIETGVTVLRATGGLRGRRGSAIRRGRTS